MYVYIFNIFVQFDSGEMPAPEGENPAIQPLAGVWFDVPSDLHVYWLELLNGFYDTATRTHKFPILRIVH